MADEDTKGTEREAGRDRAGDEREAARKERVLHTRVPAVLEDELKRLATNLKMPVSNVVRAILEDAIEAVEVVGVRAEDELKGFVTKLSEQREAIRQGASQAGRKKSEERPRDDRTDPDAKPAVTTAPITTEDAVATEPACPETDASLDDVIGFQRLTLRTDSPCTVCGRVLPRGTEACRGVRDDGGPRVLLGPRCSLLPTSE
jgi:predicted DNA-binding protein